MNVITPHPTPPHPKNLKNARPLRGAPTINIYPVLVLESTSKLVGFETGMDLGKRDAKAYLFDLAEYIANLCLWQTVLPQPWFHSSSPDDVKPFGL